MRNRAQRTLRDGTSPSPTDSVHRTNTGRDKPVPYAPATVQTRRGVHHALDSERGSLEVGKKADINVIDIDRVAERQPKRVADFPSGASRLLQAAVGYRATLVNGVVILEDDELTG